MIKCKKCGKDIFEGSTFCNYCGAKIDDLDSINNSDENNNQTRNSHDSEEKETSSCLKWVLICFAALLVVFLFAWDLGACSTAAPEESTNTIDNSLTEPQYNNVTFSTNPLYDENGIAIYLNEIENTESFSLEVDNNSDKDISFALNSIAVNNCMIGYVDAEETITIGNKTIVTCDIYSSDFYGIDVIQTIDFEFCCEDENCNTVAEAICHVETSAYTVDIHHLDFEKYEKIYADENLEVFKVSDGNKVDAFSFLYYNKSSDVIDVAKITDVSLNGIMIEHYDIESSVGPILPGCIDYTNAEDGTVIILSALEEELEEKNITDVESFQGKINYSINYNEIASGLITIK